MVESDKAKHATPITFDWTGINHPKSWEVNYKNLRLKYKILSRSASVIKTLMFYRTSNSFILPNNSNHVYFQPPIKRIASVSSSNTHFPHIQSSHPVFEEPCTSSSENIIAKHRGHHKYFPACKMVSQKMKQKSSPSMFMLSLPKIQSNMKVTTFDGLKLYT